MQLKWRKKIYMSGNSYHISVPMAWVRYIQIKFGFTPKEVNITAENDTLLVQAVKPEKETK